MNCTSHNSELSEAALGMHELDCAAGMGPGCIPQIDKAENEGWHPRVDPQEDVLKDLHAQPDAILKLGNTMRIIDLKTTTPEPLKSFRYEEQPHAQASVVIQEQIMDIMRSPPLGARLRYPEEYYALCWEALAIVLRPGESANWWDMPESKRILFRTFINEVKHS